MWVDMDLSNSPPLTPTKLGPNPNPIPGILTTVLGPNYQPKILSSSFNLNQKNSTLVIHDVEAADLPRKKRGQPPGARNRVNKTKHFEKGKESLLEITEEKNNDQKKRKIMDIVSIECSLLPSSPNPHHTIQSQAATSPAIITDTQSDAHSLDIIFSVLTRPSIANHLVHRGLLSQEILKFIPNPAVVQHPFAQSVTSPTKSTHTDTTTNIYNPKSPIITEERTEQKIHSEPYTGVDNFITIDSSGTEKSRAMPMSVSHHESNSHQSSLLISPNSALHNETIKQARQALQLRQSVQASYQPAKQNFSNV